MQTINNSLIMFPTTKFSERMLVFFNTPKKESINQQIVRFVLKFKHYHSTTASLDTRTASVVNIVKYGYEKYYNELINQVANSEQEQPFVTIGIS